VRYAKAAYSTGDEREGCSETERNMRKKEKQSPSKRVKLVILACIAACLYYSGLVRLARWWEQRSGQSLVILNYHRAKGGDLRRHLLYLRRHYRILHLEAALEELFTPSKYRSQTKDRRTPLVLTFDDGYYDNYTYAMTLAGDLQIPITIFLVPGYIESGNRFWWLEPDHLVHHAQVSKATIEGCTYHLDKLGERKALSQAIETRIRHATSVSEREKFLASVRKVLVEASPVIAEERDTLPFAWAEVQAMKETGWVSFGAHTMHHPILAYLTDPVELQYEVSRCRVVLERQLGQPVRTFAYPIGKPEHIGEKGLHAAQAAGYDWALTTIDGINSQKSNPYLLHRSYVDVNHHWLVVAARVSLWLFLIRLYRKPITLIQKLRSASST
jgi:peptidoglycan/xylan/chitin deacetylase (PgdA/CDA1 family)